MKREIEKRLSRLEGDNSEDIPVFCEHESDVEATVDAMIAAGEIVENDRSRCVFWEHSKSRQRITHEEALLELD